MLDSIIKNIGPELIGKITGQFNLSEDQASKTMDITKDTILSTATQEVGKGNLDGVLAMVNQGSAAKGSSTFQNIANNLVGTLSSKLGLSDSVATKLTDFVLPFLLDKLAAKTGGNADKKDLMEMLGDQAGNFLQGKAGDMLGGLGNLLK